MLFFGRPSAPTTISLAALGSNGVAIIGAEAGDYHGISVSGAGDVNGDGYDDLIVGSDRADAMGNLRPSAGESYVIYGKESLPSVIDLASLGTGGVTIFGGNFSDQSGGAVSSAGDVNGDGYDDLAIGAFRAAGLAVGLERAGETYIVFGGVALPSTIDLGSLGSAGVVIKGIDNDDYSGFSVSSAGDINGDGFDDLVMGASNSSGSNNLKDDAGESYVLYGSSSLAAIISLATLGAPGFPAGFTLFGGEANDRTGFSVSGAGDINGDGFDDLIIGAPFAESLGGPINAGVSYLVFGGASLTSSINLKNIDAIGIAILGIGSSDASGTSVSNAGDVNGDGFDDLLIGARFADASANLKFAAGESYLILGSNSFTSSATHLGTGAAETLTGNAAANIMVGGRDNDLILGNGGADVLIGGQGNDVLAVNSLAFRKIVGGTGNDTLRFDAAGLTIDLETIKDNRIQGIETIDMTGTGNNVLTLTQREVLNLSDSSNVLLVRRNLGDVVNRGPSWTQLVDEVIGGDLFQVYSQGNALLKVQAVNLPPVIGNLGNSVTYIANGAPVLIAANATVTDSDSANFENGTLTFGTIIGGEETDRFQVLNQGLGAGQIGVAGANILFGGVVIGTRTGGAGTTPLIITFNANATATAVQALLRNVTWRNISAAPVSLPRLISVSLTDGDGSLSPPLSKQINVTN